MPPTLKTKNDYGKVSNHPRTIPPLGPPLHGEGRNADGVQLARLPADRRHRRILRRNDGRRRTGLSRIRPEPPAQGTGLHQDPRLHGQERRHALREPGGHHETCLIDNGELIMDNDLSPSQFSILHYQLSISKPYSQH